MHLDYQHCPRNLQLPQIQLNLQYHWHQQFLLLQGFLLE
jgi:hypothetical protein